MGDKKKAYCSRGVIVVFACFGVNTLMLGYLKCFGILFVEYIEEFHSSASLTSAVMGLTSATTSIMSMAVLNFLMERVTIRKLALTGALCASTGVVLSSRATSIEFLFFSHSLLVGSAQGLMYGPGIVLIGQYFRNRRTLATAVATSGVSLGSVLLPLLLRFLIDLYTLRGALLIMGGLLMEMLVLAALYFPPNPRKVQKGSLIVSQDSKIDDGMAKEPEALEEDQAISFKKVNKDVPNLLNERLSMIKNNDSRSLNSLGNISRNFSPKIYRSKEMELKQNKLCLEHLHCSMESFDSNLGISDSKGDLRRDKYASFTDSICLSTFSLQENVTDSECSTKRRLSSVFGENIALFKNPRFLIIAGFTFFGNIGTCLFSSFIPPLANEIGLTDVESAFLVSLYAGLDFISRLASGIIAELPHVNRRYMLLLMFLVLGVICQLTIFYRDLQLMLLFVVLFGLINGVYPALVPPLLLDFLGKNKFSKVFGFVQVFHGSCLSISYPLLGILRDQTGTYTTCFYFLGASQFVAAAILLLEPWTRNEISSTGGDE